jgi:hypothetical protein
LTATISLHQMGAAMNEQKTVKLAVPAQYHQMLFLKQLFQFHMINNFNSNSLISAVTVQPILKHFKNYAKKEKAVVLMSRHHAVQ